VLEPGARGQPLVKDGKTLLSGIDPVRRAERTADAVCITDKTLYFCPSPLYGYGLERFLSRLEALAPNSAVLCVETDSELFELSSKNIPSFLVQNKKLHITNVCDIAELVSLVRSKWGGMAFRRIETIRFTGGWQLSAQVYDSLCDALRREIAVDWSNALTLTKLGRLYIRNFLRNLTLIPYYHSIANLSFGSSPVLVLGAGPSLDEILDFLCLRFSHEILAKTLGNDSDRPFKIICVDTCLGALKDRGIVPDLVIILESQHWNIRDFLGCYDWNVSAAVDLSALPASARILCGQGFLFFTPWTHLRVFERLKDTGLLPAVIPPLGSVGLTAVELARRLTSGKILCAGLDFSFTADKYHARSTPGHRSCLNRQTRFRRILNSVTYETAVLAAVSKTGVSVSTNPIMKNYRDLFEQEFASDKRLFDINGSGLSLGVNTLSLEEAVSLLRDTDKVNVQENVNLFPPCASSRSGGVDAKLLSFFEGEKKRLQELRGILTGDAASDKERLNILLDECDYLWAHFPDCAGGRQPEIEDITFLKRVRAEIDPMLKLFISVL
jgi:hypothetical protein